MSRELRNNYADAVLTHFVGHQLWKDNATILAVLTCDGGGYGSAQDGYKDFVFRERNEELRQEVLSTMVEIVPRMDVFEGPQRLVASAEQRLLVSPDGWLLLTGEWLDDEPVAANVKVLRVRREMFFSPRNGANEKQDLRRLDWVTWSPPLDQR